MKKAGIVLCIVFLVGILLISSASASLLSELWHKLSGKDASLTGFQTKASGSSAPLKKEICNNFDDHGVPKDDNGNRLANCEDSVPCPKGTPCDENDPAKKCLEDKTCGLSREDAAKCDDTDGGKKPDKFGEIFINNNPNSVAFDICVNKDGSVGQDGAVKYVKEFFCKSPDKSKYLFQIMKCKGKWLCSEGKCAYFKMQETEANCSDGFDNDEDSSVDCADSDCEGQT